VLLFYLRLPAVVLTLPAVDLGESSYIRIFPSGVASGSRFPGALNVNNTAAAFHTASRVPSPTSPRAFGGCVDYETQHKDELMSIDATLPNDGGSSFPLGGHVMCGQTEEVPMPIDHPFPSFKDETSPASSSPFTVYYARLGQPVEDIMMSNDDTSPTPNGIMIHLFGRRVSNLYII